MIAIHLVLHAQEIYLHNALLAKIIIYFHIIIALIYNVQTINIYIKINALTYQKYL